MQIACESKTHEYIGSIYLAVDYVGDLINFQLFFQALFIISNVQFLN